MRRFAPLVAVLLVLGVAGCGSSGSKKTNAQSSGTTASTAAGQTTSTTVPSFSGNSNSHYCQLASDVEKKSSAQASTDLKATFAAFDSEASQFISAAPSSIKADAQTLVNGIKQYEQVLQKANFDFTKLSPTDLQFFQDPKFEQAAANVEAYNTQVCGLGTTTTT